MPNTSKRSSAKVAIVGSGQVGSTCAYTLMVRGIASEIVLIDMQPTRAEGEAMDMSHGLPYTKPVLVRGGLYSDCEGADVIIVTAGAPRKPGETRLDLAQKNADIITSLLPQLESVAPDAVILIVTNPVDIITYVATKVSSLPKGRVFGTGTVLDSARLRYLLSQHCNVDPKNVHAYILGEHGDSAVPAWSLASIGGARLDDWCGICGNMCGGDMRQQIFEQVKGAGAEVIKRKGATNWAIGLAVADIVEAIVRDEHSVLTVSYVLDGHLGVSDVALSVPVLVDRTGVAKLLEVRLTDGEQKALAASAGVLKEVISGLTLKA